MNHSGLATISDDAIRLSPDLLTPLGIRSGSRVWGLYYPRPRDYAPDVGVAHDFMITPVPFELWPYAARLKMRLNFRRGDALRRIVEALAAQNVRVLLLQCSRSGHRYATLTATVAFEALRKPIESFANQFPSLESHVEETENSTTELLKHMEQKFTSDLFYDIKLKNLTKPISGERLHALKYFYLATALRKVGQRAELKHRAFELENVAGILRPDARGKEVLHAAFGKSLPTRGFVEMDTRDVNLRIAVIERQQIAEFATVRVSYSWNRTGQHASRARREVLSSLLHPLGSQHVLWRVTNYHSECSDASERCTVDCVVQSKQAGGDQWTTVKSLLQMGGTATPVESIRVEEVSVNPFSFFRVFLSLKSEARADDIIKSCHKVGERLGMLPDDFKTVRTNIHQVTKTVADEIRKCNAMLQYYGHGSTSGRTFEWLSAELLAAEVLSIPVVIIKEQSIERSLIRTIGGQAPIEITDNPSSDVLDRNVELALIQLTNAVISPAT